VIAEVDKNRRRVYSDTAIHVSEVDRLVEHCSEQITDEELPQRVAHVKPDERRQRMIEYGMLQLSCMLPRFLEIFELLDVAGLDSFSETMGCMEAWPMGAWMNMLGIGDVRNWFLAVDCLLPGNWRGWYGKIE